MGKKSTLHELTCHSFSDMHAIWLTQSAVPPFVNKVHCYAWPVVESFNLQTA